MSDAAIIEVLRRLSAGGPGGGPLPLTCSTGASAPRPNHAGVTDFTHVATQMPHAGRMSGRSRLAAAALEVAAVSAEAKPRSATHGMRARFHERMSSRLPWVAFVTGLLNDVSAVLWAWP